MRNRPAPAPDASAFVELCKELLPHGALRIAGFGFEATFAAPPPPQKAVVAPVPRELPKKPDGNAPTDARAAFRETVVSLAEKAGRTNG